MKDQLRDKTTVEYLTTFICDKCKMRWSVFSLTPDKPDVPSGWEELPGDRHLCLKCKEG